MIDRRTLPLSALRAFESAGQHLHLGRAGAALGVSHSAISHQIRVLETQFGVSLFSRSGRGLQLTSAGERLLAAVSAGFDTMAEGLTGLRPDALEGPLIIGCTESTANNWLLRHVLEFRLHYADIAPELVRLQPGQQDIPQRIDVAICYGEPQAGNRLVQRLFAPPVLPYASAAALYGRPPITGPKDLFGMHLLDDGQNSWQRWFEKSGVTRMPALRQTRVFSTTLALRAARDGFGVVLANPLEVADDLRAGRLQQLLDLPMEESREYFLLTARPEHQNLRAELFIDWLLGRLSVGLAAELRERVSGR